MKASRITIFVAAIVLVSALAVFLASLRAETITIYVPSKDIGAYQRVDENDLQELKVLKDAEDIRGNEITFETVDKLIKKSDGYIFFDVPVFKGERVDKRHLKGNKLGTLSVVVAPDERVVAVSASLLGSVARIVRPGDVVSVVGSDGAKLAEYAKIISVGSGAEAGEGVVTDPENSKGSSKDSGGGSQSSGSGSGNLTLLLAVATDEAEVLANANQGVVFIYNPFCKTQADGSIRPIDQEGAAEACPQTTGGSTSVTDEDSSSSDSASADDKASSDEEASTGDETGSQG
jgi:hypothetical protein